MEKESKKGYNYFTHTSGREANATWMEFYGFQPEERVSEL
jgi:hypothetical protein